jgi:hypothetical protein
MAESRIVHCGEHGERRPTFVCRHLLGGSARGFFEGQPNSVEDSDERCAWCEECERIRQKHGGWNDESEAFAGVTMICDLCFDATRLRNQVNVRRPWWKLW